MRADPTCLGPSSENLSQEGRAASAILTAGSRLSNMACAGVQGSPGKLPTLSRVLHPPRGAKKSPSPKDGKAFCSKVHVLPGHTYMALSTPC